jgi:hypothetical protein
VHRDICRNGETLVLAQLHSSVPGQRRQQPLREQPDLPDQRIGHAPGVFAIHLHEYQKARLALNQARGTGVLPT